MARGLRRAMKRGKRADHWYYDDDCLILRHPNGREEYVVPVPNVADDEEMLRHYLALADEDWVSRAAIAELREIVGARA